MIEAQDGKSSLTSLVRAAFISLALRVLSHEEESEGHVACHTPLLVLVCSAKLFCSQECVIVPVAALQPQLQFLAMPEASEGAEKAPLPSADIATLCSSLSLSHHVLVCK